MLFAQQRAVRGIRLLKLMRILRLSRKMAKVDFSRRLNPSIVRLIVLLGKIVFAGHLLGCMWFMVDECDVNSDEDLWQTCGGDSLGSKVRRHISLAFFSVESTIMGFHKLGIYFAFEYFISSQVSMVFGDDCTLDG